MNDCHDDLIQELKIKINQHEKTITQLLQIIGSTNRRLSDFVENQDTKIDPPQKKFITS